MVGEGEGHHPSSGEPTRDTTENDTIRQHGPGAGSRVDQRLIPISFVQCPQPTRRMKDRGAWVSLYKLLPARIFQRIECINHQTYAEAKCVERSEARSDSRDN